MTLVGYKFNIMALTYFRNIQYFKLTYIKNNIISSQLRSISSKNTPKLSKTITHEVTNEIEDLDKPIEYLKSDAAQWKAHISRSGVVETGPWFQPYVISASLAIFMIYFFFLREESDIDLELNKNLYDRINGLEEKNLEIVLKYNKNNNITTSDIENRLEEIRSSEQK